jgi:uracil-DNA glycosylase family 4
LATHAQCLHFDSSCRRCERLASHLDTVRAEYPDYYAQPVPSFGEAGVRLLIVGLAPGKHGANATGRPFTGDYAGILLYQTLHKFGFASQPVSSSVDDGLHLIDCRITNAVRCLPPGNKPTTGEIDTCNAYLAGELATMPRPGIIVALGTIAHRATLKALGLRLSAYPFGHGAEHPLNDELRLIDSYHCSRYNTQTRRLTTVMFEDIFRTVQQHLAP